MAHNTTTDSQAEDDEEGEAPHSVLFALELNFYKLTIELLSSLPMGPAKFPARLYVPYEMTRSWVRAAEKFEKPDGSSAQLIAMDAVCGVFNAYRQAGYPRLPTDSFAGIFNDAVLREISAIGPRYDQALQGGAA
ncbi:MAG: hypothetical protein ACTIDN_06345 [Acetobacter sp.]|uniref:hypothetical protein n=1 Tax=Acetobacter sp. TaxID=440 RepID=UPI003F91CD21